jgi:hypothetical protein
METLNSVDNTRMTSNGSDVRAVLEEQRQRQLRFHLKQGAWIAWVPVVGFGLSSMGLIAARALAQDGVGLSTAKLAFLWFGFVSFGLGLAALLTVPFRLKARIVPYFARQIAEYGGKSARAFVRGRGLYREIAALENLADTLGVKPLSTFGFADDFYGQKVQWHAASEGVKTVEALRQGLGARLPAALDAAHDLEALASVLRVAADQGVDFCLALRIHRKDSLQVVSSMELRQGRFW